MGDEAEKCPCICDDSDKPCIKIDTTPFGGNSEYTSEYVPWPLDSRAQSMRPAPRSIDPCQPRYMDTNYRCEYTPKPIEPRKQLCKKMYKPPEARMEGDSIYRSDFIGSNGGPGKSYKPSEEFRPPVVPMDGGTLYRNSYRPYDGGEMRSSRPDPFRGSRGPRLPDVPMAGNTTFSDDYRPWPNAPRVGPICHPANLCPDAGFFNEPSTYASDYTPKPLMRLPPCKGAQEYFPPKVPFDGISTMVDDFRVPAGGLRSESYKPCASYQQPQARMDGLTTYVDDYVPWKSSGRERPPWASKTKYEPPRVGLDAISTYRENYMKPCGERRDPFKPPDNKLGGCGPMEDGTTYTNDYTRWCGARPADSYKMDRCYKRPNMPMEGLSTMKHDYTGAIGPKAVTSCKAAGEAEKCLKNAGDNDYNTIYGTSFKDPFCMMPKAQACNRRVKCPCKDIKCCKKFNCPVLKYT